MLIKLENLGIIGQIDVDNLLVTMLIIIYTFHCESNEIK